MLGSALKTRKVVKKTAKPKKEPKKDVPKFTEAEINGKYLGYECRSKL